MTFIPQQQEKHCFISCSEDKVNAGLCDCINRMRNEALRQQLVSGCRQGDLCIICGKEIDSEHGSVCSDFDDSHLDD